MVVAELPPADPDGAVPWVQAEIEAGHAACFVVLQAARAAAAAVNASCGPGEKARLDACVGAVCVLRARL